MFIGRIDFFIAYYCLLKFTRWFNGLMLATNIMGPLCEYDVLTTFIKFGTSRLCAWCSSFYSKGFVFSFLVDSIVVSSWLIHKSHNICYNPWMDSSTITFNNRRESWVFQLLKFIRFLEKCDKSWLMYNLYNFDKKKN